MLLKRLGRFVVPAGLLVLLAAAPSARDLAMPRYDHIFLIIDENKNSDQVVGTTNATALDRLAREYGIATSYYAVTHPSEPNYVAMLGGTTLGITDDDAYYCRPNDLRAHCPHARTPGYPSHTSEGANLGSQFDAANVSWRIYAQSLPAPGSGAVIASDPNAGDVPPTMPVYASKHIGFLNFASFQRDPKRAERLVGFDRLKSDLRADTVPNFSYIIPNLCDDMHGASDADGPPEDCKYAQLGELVQRGDRTIAKLVASITASKTWNSSQRDAIVITFDEDDDGDYVGCCGSDPKDLTNRGGGLVATVVVTNHGPRALKDATPYNHYSLLRTLEDAFGIHNYLGHANDPGVLPMTPLFSK